MEVIRNFINVIGLSDIDELPTNINGQLIQYSESETIHIPKNYPDVKSIFQVLINIEIISTRHIVTPVGTTIVVDGIKLLKIIYAQPDNSSKATFLVLELPYNTFFELDKDIEFDNINIHILDAYFSLLDERRIYGHYILMVEVLTKSLKEACDNKAILETKKTSTIQSYEYICNQNNSNNSNELIEYDNESNDYYIDLDAEYL